MKQRAKESAQERHRGDLLRRPGAPLAAILAVAGQALLARKDLGLWRGVVPGVALYALASGVFMAALRAGPGRRSDGSASAAADPTATPSERVPPRVLEWGLLVAVLLGGLYLRLYRIDLVPWGLNNDEAINAAEANEIARGKPFSTVTERGLQRETMFHYLAAFSYRHPGLGLNLLRAMPSVFGLGRRRIEDTLMDQILPLRAVAIAAGTLTILALYVFVRWRFGWRVALLAAFFLAVSPWHLLYSRVGERVILAPLFAIAAVGFFLRALESGRVLHHLAWGAAVGLGFWTYTSFRSLPLALLAFLAVRRPVRSSGAISPRQRWGGFLVGAGLAVTIFLVILALSHLSMKDFLFRGTYALWPPRSNRWLNLLHASTVVNFFPPRYAVIQSDAFISDGISAVYGLIGLEPETILVAALATLGILCAAWRAIVRPGDDTCALILLCFAALACTVGLAGPSLTRMLLNLPWLCLFASLFAWRLLDDLAALKRPFTPGLAAGALVGMIAVASVLGYRQYFQEAGRSERAMQHFGAPQTIMGMFVRSLPAGPVVYVLHTLRVDALRYLIGDRPDVHLVTDPSTLDLDAIGRQLRTVTFVVEYARPFAEPLRYLMTRFPQGDMTQVADARLAPDKPIFFTFTLWKDASGQPVPAPGSSPGGSPGGAPPPP